jgi:hypothetical protein
VFGKNGMAVWKFISHLSDSIRISDYPAFEEDKVGTVEKEYTQWCMMTALHFFVEKMSKTC